MVMEITTLHPQTPTPKQSILTPLKRVDVPNNNKPICSKIVTVPNSSPSSSSVQIQLPLQRPQRHELRKPINKTPLKPNNNKPVIRSTISDVLNLLDSIKIPISLDLYVSFIQECTKSRDPLQAIEVHNHIRTSSLRPSFSILNRLLVMYISCYLIEYAQKLFDKMTVKSSCTWAVMVAGYFENGDYDKVIDLFVEIRSCDCAKGERGDLDKIAVSGIVICVLKACAKTMNLELGKQLHGWIIKMGYGDNLVLNSSLISFYGKVGCLEASDSVFYQVHNRNKVIWTARIVNCCNDEKFYEAIDVFREMGKEGVKKNSFTFTSVLKACARMRDGGCCGQQVHASVIKLGLELNEHVQCGLVDMYGKGGLVKDARKAFKLCGNKRNVACWNAILSSCIEQGLGFEAAKIVNDMKAAGLQPKESLINEVKFICGNNLIETRKG